MQARWIIVAAVIVLAAVVIFGSRPFTQTATESPGQPSPHSLTE
ncbi:hypothetical protein ACQKGC_23740 [Allorhizobium pseudoryzae]|jgi:hypothetical protein|nr:hypothetical protein [Allorhizobium pseudoryzae]